MFRDLFTRKPVIGVVHVQALPGSHRYDHEWDSLILNASTDAKALKQGGVDGVIIENFFDAPFWKNRVPPVTIAAMTAVVSEVLHDVYPLPVGINVLRNDAISALSIAHVCGAAFIRVNILTGSMWADQGLIEGEAAELLRLRASLQSEVLIVADVLVKHAITPGPIRIGLAAEDAAFRGCADALIVSGLATGKETDLSDVQEAKQAAPNTPVLVGSGVNLENGPDLYRNSDGLIVGTHFKEDGNVTNFVDVGRVRTLVRKIRRSR